MRALLVLAFGVILATAFAPCTSQAMPVFAEAYGYDCSKCHIQVPALNSYGRYVARTMYAALDRQTLAAIVPVWVGESANSDTQSTFEPHHLQFGNLAAHAAGYVANDVTTHIQQWFSQGDLAGPLDAAWISYDHLLGKDTHFVVGKQEVPGPSLFSQWMDLAPFAVPGTMVGEHTFQLQDNRWGAKAGWSNTVFSADVGWFASEEDLNGATDFSGNNDKAIQWNVAYAPAIKPYQIGLYGSHGTTPLTEGGIDRYAAVGAYFALDPTPHSPGVLVLHQNGWDGNAGQSFGPAASNGTGVELSWKPLHHYEGLLSFREELQSDGLGTITHSANVDLNFRIARFVHATLEEYAATNSRSGARYQVWWTTPLQRAH